ncbi:MAG: class I adenylate-forming enzyme family protein [Steroidobacteraceae bacterium]
MTATLNALWDETERLHGDRVALIQGATRWTYRELGERIRGISASLCREAQVAPGDAVALLSPNVPEFVAAYFAILRLAGAVQPVDTRTPPQRWLSELRETHARALVVHESLAASAATAAAGARFPGHTLAIGPELPAVAGGNARDGHVTAESIAELMHTSGTTGIAKAAMRTHANVLAAARNATRGFGYVENDVIAVVMPLSHSSALNSQLIPFIRFGAAIVLIDRFEPDEVIETLRTHSVTCMRLVPSMARLLLGRDHFRGDHLPAIRMLINSSAPVEPATLASLKARFPRVAVMDSYGLTEASTCTVLTVDPARPAQGSVGRAIEGVILEIVDDAGRPAASGMEGEVRLRGEHVFAGYLGMPDESARALKDGWLWTGDLGHLDDAGNLYLHGRSSEVIHCSGYTVHPATVENCILEMPEVEAVAVTGVAHKLLGQVVKAFVISREPGIEPRKIVNHCVRSLPSHAVPFHVEFVDTLPRNVTGKLIRRQLKEMSA